MRRVLPLLLIAAVFASCASSSQPGTVTKAKLPEPAIGLEQEVGPAELNYPYGPIEIKYNLAVENRAPQEIKLIRVDISTLNPSGGAYSLRHDFYNFNQSIPANSTGVVTFWAKGFSWGRSMRDTEPVTVRGIAYFESGAGTFQKVFIRELQQFGR